MPSAKPSAAAVATGTLFVAATPLGNLQDVAPRLVQTLSAAHTVFAEDTRRARQLLSHLGLHRPLFSLHAHNEQRKTPIALRLVAQGHTVIYISDAGTPAVSDPGAALVQAAHAAGLSVSPVAGPSALTAALSVAGFADTQGILFAGFLPSSGKARRTAAEQWLKHRGCIVLFEAPHRICATLALLAAAQPDRPACLCRELTKLHEQILRAPLQALHSWAAAAPPRGEITLVVGPTLEAEIVAAPSSTQDIDAALTRVQQAGLSLRDASTAVAALLGQPRRAVYQRALAAQAG